MIERLEFSLTIEDFLTSGWKEVINKIQPPVVEFYTSALLQQSLAENEIKKKAVLEFLGRVTESHLNADRSHNPIFNIDLFSDEDLSYLVEIKNEIDEPDLRARVIDIIWLRNKSRNLETSEHAITSYLESAKKLEDVNGGRWTVIRIMRALDLAALTARNRPIYQEVIDYIIDLLNRCNGEDPLYLSAELMTILQNRREGDPAKYASFSEKLANNAEAQNDYEKARRYWDIKYSWHRLSGEQDLARDAKIKIAETYEKEAEFNRLNHSLPFTMASYNLEQAIRAYRDAGNTADKVETIKLKLREYQQETGKERVSFPEGDLNIPAVKEEAIKNVADRPFNEALIRFANSFSSPKMSELREQVEEYRRTHLLRQFFPIKLEAADGRIIAREPEDEQEAIHAEMYMRMRQTRRLYVANMIDPSRRTIYIEHYIRTQDFLPFLIDNPFVPIGREWIIAQGLHAGFYYDFMTAVHLLIPQIEESFRHILIKLNVASSTFDDKGIQNELNLNQFLKEEHFVEKLIEIFGEDFIFDLRGLLVERFGDNLRNDMAHGLLDYYALHSDTAIYLWWISLRFYLILRFSISNLNSSQTGAVQSP